ncbi:HAMP domain-containing methyl-accepting chemotaxis protein [Gemmatimonas groenlandica]|uniref:Methyl-accepting chemotaxis protein n=1 Tax=Gemmatimonas groenlandica TaxID=2732249 RepID=A0A6M4IWI3_9BACT|nr:methyl-accepting chemotaxis protein [Gemmatimonas groenlandica]QJR36551.1 hypothetical protein HKW67_14060 [Gemmatimonas groenlandica]
MQWLNNLKIRAKLLTMMGVSLALTVVVGGFALWRMNAVHAEGVNISSVLLPSVKYIGEVSATAREIQSLQFQHIAMPDDAGMNDIETRLTTAFADLEASKKSYEVLPATTEETAAYARFNAAWTTYIAPWESIRLLSRAQKAREANGALTSMLDEYQVVDQELIAVSEINAKGATAATAKAAAIYAQSKLFVMLAVALAAILGMAMALVVSGRIAKTVSLLAERTQSLRHACIAGTRRGLSAMAVGDLSVSVTSTTTTINNTDGDEIGDISRAVDAIIGDIQETIAAFSSTQSTIRTVIGETQMLVDAAIRGDLVKRADAQRHQGAFRQLVEGMNGTLAAVAAPIGEAKSVLGRLADKDLTGRMSGSYEGDYAEMQSSINLAIENLENTITQVATASDQVASASTQITAGGQSLASGSSEQAASLEEVSASVQEFATMARQSAVNATEAQTMSIDARTNATEGAARMQRLTEAVNEIKQSSSETAKIMKSIEEIAFQTNLLALNAAVEAARAGDAGRGFAVVAEEVRSLAIRSAEASKSTAELIERGLASAERGVSLNAEVSQSFGRINDQVERVAEVMAQIASAANQQASGVSQINVALEQLNQVTQQVAANAEESASAAEELNSQAASLNDTVSAFTLASDATGSSRRSFSGGRSRGRSLAA